MKNLDLSTLPAKKRKQIVSCLRAGIQLYISCFFRQYLPLHLTE